MRKAERLIKRIKVLNRKLYQARKELKMIQSQCKHVFPDLEEKKKAGKVFGVICLKCGYFTIITKYTLIKS